jgi:trimeric autotransporter adhesin
MKLKNACFVLSLLFWVSMAHAQVTGSGTTQYVPLWTGGETIGDSAIYQNGEWVGIGTKSPRAKLNVVSTSTTSPAITGNANATVGYTQGVSGSSASTSGIGVIGNATATTGDAYGVFGQTATTGFGAGVIGVTTSTTGTAFGGFFQSASTGAVALFAHASAPSGTSSAITGQIESPNGVAGYFVAHAGAGLILLGTSGSNNADVFSVDASGNGSFSGNLSVTGNLTKGSGSFKIDHPLDPANKYLSHSFVESPDMMNIYNGLVVLDTKGESSVILPDYFQSLNSDFRYQLTAIGAPGPNLYVAEEISGNHFKIAGGKPGAKVSWQVTGIRQDAYAKAHRINVEEDKPEQQRGHYLHPELFGATEKEAIGTTRPPAMTLPVPSVNVSEGNLR